ncbi:MAG: hypothetical protein HFJ43_04600 [Clostridia bacterium]|nr:hypothetical protein [Clostridia bacterium]
MKEKNNKLVVCIILIILIIITSYFIYTAYKKNKEKDIKESKSVITEEGYLLINTTGNKEERANINEIIKNDNNTYTLKGLQISRYTITENEYDYLKNQVPLVVDGIKYYFTWSDKYNEYIFVSKENNKEYYLEKDNATGNYFVNIHDDPSIVYRITDKKVEITIDENIECEIKDTNEKILAKRIFEEQEATYGTYYFEIENKKCKKIIFEF